MGTVTMEGIDFTISGNEPTQEESIKIQTALAAKKQGMLKTGNKAVDEQLSTFQITPKDVLDESELGKYDEDTENFLSSPTFKRLVLEVGFSIAGAVGGAALAPVTGGTSLAATTASVANLSRVARYARPLLNMANKKLTRMTIGAAAGGGTGAGVAQFVDPKEDITKEVARGAFQGALGEVMGFGVSKALAGTYNKIWGRKLNYLTNAEDALNIFTKQKDDLLKILAKPRSQLSEKQLQLLQKYEAKYGDDILKQIKSAAITPAQLIDNGAIDTAENILQASFGGSVFLQSAKQGSSKVLQIGLDDMVDTAIKMDQGLIEAGENLDVVGSLIRDSITKKDRLYTRFMQRQFNQLDKDILAQGGKGIDLTKLKEFATKLSKDSRYIPAGEAGAPARQMIDDILRIGDGQTNVVDYATFNLNRGALGKNKAGRFGAPRVHAMLEKAFEDTLTNSPIPPSLVNKRNELAQMYKANKDMFSDGVLKKIMNENFGQEKIYKEIVAVNNPKATTQFYDFINNHFSRNGKITAQGQRIKDGIKGQFLREMLEAGSKKDGSYVRIDGNKLSAFTSKYKQLLNPKNKFFTEAEAKNISQSIKALTVAQNKIFAPGSAAGPGSIFMQLKQSGAATTFLAGGVGYGVGTGDWQMAGGIVLAPTALSYLFTRPGVIQKFINGGSAVSYEKGLNLTRGLTQTLVAGGFMTDSEASDHIEEYKLGKEKLEQIRKQGYVKPEYAEEVIANSEPVVETSDIQEQQQNIATQETQPNLPTPSVPLPNVTPSNLPMGGQQSNTELAQALNLFSKGGIVSAKKNF